MAKVLLFGATGFLGDAVVRALRTDARVTSVVAAGRRPPPELEWVRHDLVTGGPDDLAELLAELRPDAVVNCAGRLTGSYAELVAANTGAVAQLVDALAGVAPRTRLVTLGSAAEYGVVPPDRAVRETDPARPVSGYGVTRLAATQLVELASAAGQVDGIVLRVFNPIGPGLPEANVAGRAIRELQRALAGGSHEIRLGPLDAYRDFVDVRDVARAVVAAVFVATPPRVVCNVGSGAAVRARTLVRLLADAAGFTGTVTESAPPSVRSPGVDWIAADLERTVATLGWAPHYGLAESAELAWGTDAATPAA